MIVSWFSAGISSFVATWLMRDKIDKIIYCHIDDQHEDSMRFVRDSEALLGKKIEIMQSRYKSVSEVIRATGYVKNARGYAKCTDYLKKRVRQEWEATISEELTYVWGLDCDEKGRAESITNKMPNQTHVFPLIDRGLTKQDCHAMAARMGIKRPVTYDLGFQNNNCIPCVKAGMWAMNLVRKTFPEKFNALAKLEREIGASCINGIYLDELEPDRGRPEEEISSECGILCFIESEAGK